MVFSPSCGKLVDRRRRRQQKKKSRAKSWWVSDTTTTVPTGRPFFTTLRLPPLFSIFRLF